jgi:hypothetical protein
MQSYGDILGPFIAAGQSDICVSFKIIPVRNLDWYWG